MRSFLFRALPACFLALAWTTSCAAASPFRPKTEIGRVVFDPAQKALVMPYLGAIPVGTRRAKGDRQVDFEFQASHFLSPDAEKQTLKGHLKGFSIANLPGGVVRVTLTADRPLNPFLKVDAKGRRLLLYPFAAEAPLKGAPQQMPEPLVSMASPKVTTLGKPEVDASKGQLIIPYEGPAPHLQRHALGTMHVYYDIPAARLQPGAGLNEAPAGPLTRLAMANRPEGAVRVAFEADAAMAPQARVEAHQVVIALGLSPHAAAPASGPIRTHIGSASFDAGRDALVLHYTGALPSYALNRVAPAAFGLAFARTDLSATASGGGSAPALRWWVISAPQEKAVHLSLTLPRAGDLLVAADAKHHELLLLPQPASRSPLPPPPDSGVRTVFGHGHFDWHSGAIALPYSGSTPAYAIETVAPGTLYVDFANAGLQSPGVQLERVSHFDKLSSWLLAKRPTQAMVRLVVHGAPTEQVRVQDDRTHQRLLVTPFVPGASPAPAPTSNATPAVRPS